MDVNRIKEEKLREATCFGDEEAVRTLVEKGVNINAQHEINGWTALHWAAKRGHANIIAYLLEHGADKTLLSKKGETPAVLTDNQEILNLLGAPSSGKRIDNPLPITPGYMAYPPLNHKVDTESPRPGGKRPAGSVNGMSSTQQYPQHHASDDAAELVLKVRVAHTNDSDFIEVELPRTDLSYSRLLRVSCEELGVDLKHVLKIRKLPDTVVRKDKDVRRLHDLQELELVLTTSRSPNGTLNTTASSFPSIPGFRNCTILY